MLDLQDRLQLALHALVEKKLLAVADSRFLYWCIQHAQLEEECNVLQDDALVRVLQQRAADYEFEADDWEVLLFTSVIFAERMTHNVPLCFQRLNEAGLKHPMQLIDRSAGLEDLLGCQSNIAHIVRSRCTIGYSACGGPATLREILQTPPKEPNISEFQWKPDSWKLANTSGCSVLPIPVRLWESCDADIRECMKNLPNTKCMFPRRWHVPDDQDADSAERCWRQAPTQAVNAALRLLAYRNGQEEAYQWKSTKRIYSQQGQKGDIASAYGMDMWDQLMWHGDNKNDMPEYTTHPTTVYCGTDRLKHVAALDVVKICHSAVDIDVGVWNAVCLIVTRVVHLCLHCRLPVVLFGNMFYTWVAKVVDGQLLISRPYPYCDSGDGKVTVGEVAYMVSYTAMLARGCKPWPQDVTPAPATGRGTTSMTQNTADQSILPGPPAGVVPMLDDTSGELSVAAANRCKHEALDLDAPQHSAHVQFSSYGSNTARQSSRQQTPAGQAALRKVDIRNHRLETTQPINSYRDDSSVHNRTNNSANEQNNVATAGVRPAGDENGPDVTRTAVLSTAQCSSPHNVRFEYSDGGSSSWAIRKRQRRRTRHGSSDDDSTGSKRLRCDEDVMH